MANFASYMASYPAAFQLPDPLNTAFTRLINVAQERGWELFDQDPPRLGRAGTLKIRGDQGKTRGCGRTKIVVQPTNASGTLISLKTTRAWNGRLARLPVISLKEGLGIDASPNKWDPKAAASPGRLERRVVQMGILIGFSIALASLWVIHLPKGKHEEVALPSVALGQGLVYHAEIAVLIFYGALLVLTPTFWGLIRGQLPTEITSKGAKFGAEDLNEVAAETQEVTEKHDELITEVKAGLLVANGRIKQLEEGPDPQCSAVSGKSSIAGGDGAKV